MRECSIDPESQVDESGITVMHAAALSGSRRMIEKLY